MTGCIRHRRLGTPRIPSWGGRLRRRGLYPLAVVLLLALATCQSGVGEPALDDKSVDCDQDFGDPATSPYILPFPEGKTYTIIQGYCPSNPNWGHHGSFAYDFDFAIDDTVIASRAGRVYFVREDQPNIGGNCSGGKENMVIILHDDGTAMHYVHFDSLGALVELGDRVEQGRPIGLSGNSGCSSGPHLHTSLFPNTSNFDKTSTIPLNYNNAIGPLDDNHGLIQGQAYTAGSIRP